MRNLKLKKIAFSLLIAAALLFGQGKNDIINLNITAEEADVSETLADGEIDLEALAEQIDESELVTDEQALSETKLYAENDRFELYVNETTAAFALKVKETGYIWWSSPVNADADPLAKGAQIRTMKSPVYYNVGDPVAHRTTKVTTYDGAITKNGLTVEKITNGVKFTFRVEKQGVTIPLEITLEPDYSLKVRIPADEIIEENTSGSVLIDLSLLSNFGAAGLDENGYIMVADGSGAVINFNNQKSSSTLYKGQVYGRNYAVGQLRMPSKTEQVYLPVLGMVKKSENGKDNAFLAVVTEGDENAVLRASVSGQSTTSYNTAWFDFQMRATDSFYMGTQNNQLYVYEKGEIKTGDIEVKYYPLTGEDIGTADLADVYRNYLINEKGLTKKTTENSLPYYLTLYGGTVKQQSVLGFPVNKQTSASTYKQAQEIIETLNANGIYDIKAAYNDFDEAGISGFIGSGIDYSGILGGKKAYGDLAEYINASGGSLYPSIGFMTYSVSGGGYSYMLNSCKQVTNAIAVQTPYELAYGTASEAYVFKNNQAILSPYYFTDIFRKIEASLTGENITEVSLGESGYMLYGDFSRENSEGRMYLNRKDAADVIENGYKNLKEKGISILTQAANAYLLPYSDMITNVPMYSSNFDVFDYDVPFYQMVIHGYIPYTSKSLNSSSNAEELLQMSVLTGTPLHYEMMYESPDKFEDSFYDELFYAYYKGWAEISAAEYSLLEDTVKDVSDRVITEFTVLSEYERETRFDGGKTVYINTATGEIKVNGININKADYGLKGESDYA